jgi:transcriptional regulator with PAS, ATPase and Fis domain
VLARCSPHGAIFLDEIGDVTVPVQIKLLQVLQERTFSPVGSREVASFRGRVIAATNRSLTELRSRGLCPDDFYYRLCSDAITVPPLRQRLAEDRRELDDLLQHLLARMTGESTPALVARIRSALETSAGRDYAWPGNVRELEQAVRRVLLTGRYEPEIAARDRARTLAAAVESGSLDADALLAGYCALHYERCRNLEEVARRTGIDRRTAQRYIAMAAAHEKSKTIRLPASREAAPVQDSARRNCG